ncbi:Frataxin like domain [Trypanosoma vivax]|nr:Frataxin like domain [Trypanosoma vivax]KAH8619944.1 Frataxin like domain [Trypanosoma vivax]
MCQNDKLVTKNERNVWGQSSLKGGSHNWRLPALASLAGLGMRWISGKAGVLPVRITGRRLCPASRLSPCRAVLCSVNAVAKYVTVCECVRTYGSTPKALDAKELPRSLLGMDGFTDVLYNSAADAFLEQVESALDEVECGTIEDVSLGSGVLTIETQSSGTFVLNKQAPNAQLWLSSPLSGPHHYNFVTSTEGTSGCAGQWLADTDGHSLAEKLEKELSEALGAPVRLQQKSSEFGVEGRVGASE